MSSTTTTADGHVTEKAQPKAIFACLMAALAGLMFGLDIGVISGAPPSSSRRNSRSPTR
ncbi:hypothetical protein Q3H58_003384 [Pseudomonas psychrotolerans]|nr:hypothetical protein [Pseudomonas psychrotolerans]